MKFLSAGLRTMTLSATRQTYELETSKLVWTLESLGASGNPIIGLLRSLGIDMCYACGLITLRLMLPAHFLISRDMI